MDTQHWAFVEALDLVVENLKNPDELMRILKDLGARHVDYGTRPEHYPIIGEALLQTLEV